MLLYERKGDKHEKNHIHYAGRVLHDDKLNRTGRGYYRTLLDGKQLRFDQNPIIENDRTLVPVRKIFEELGADVQWREKDSVVIAKKDDMSIRLQINSNWMLQNGELIYLDAAPKIVGDRTFGAIKGHQRIFWRSGNVGGVFTNCVCNDRRECSQRAGYQKRPARRIRRKIRPAIPPLPRKMILNSRCLL